MKNKYVLAIDIGTTGNKTVIYDLKGRVISESSAEFDLIFPKPGWVDQNANDWWKTAQKTIKATINKAKSKIDIQDIVSLSLTNQRETIVPVNERGMPLRNAIVWQDRRTIEQCDDIKEKIGEEKIYNITGLTIDPYFSGPKILWIKQYNSEIFDQTYKFLTVHDFVQHKLTGKFVIDYSNASRTMLFNINKLDWSDTILDALKIPKDKLPRPVPSGTVISKIKPDIAKNLGLSKDILVVAGAGDQQSAALGVGVTEPGLVKVTTGTGSFILSYLNNPQLDPKRRLLCSCHAIPDKWVLEASIFNSGSVLRWFRDEFCQDLVVVAKEQNKDVYTIMDQLVKKNTSVGSDGLLLLPYFTGAGAPHWDPYARGVIAGLFLGNKREQLIRSIYEGVAYEIRNNLEIMEENTKKKLEEIRITGGGAKSKIWNAIVADVCKVNVKKTTYTENTSLGAAILAASGANLFESINKASKAMINIAESQKPDKIKAKSYDDYYKHSRKIYKILKNNAFFRELQTLNSKE